MLTRLVQPRMSRLQEAWPDKLARDFRGEKDVTSELREFRSDTTENRNETLGVFKARNRPARCKT